jgi:hypothetical protein
LCCTGHLFAWAKLRSSELKTAEALGLTVLGFDPKQRGFNQPCPLWDGECTIYTSPHYPHFCGLYKCTLLKKVIEESVALPEALDIIGQAKELIDELDALLPVSSNGNFRERLVHEIEQRADDVEFQHKARRLLRFYRDHFGVKDLIDHLDEVSDSD